MPLYYAYGSNMDWSQMIARCPNTRFISIAKLKDYKLAFTRKSTQRNCGVADVLPAVGRNVWGVIYEIQEDEMVILDRKEGVNSKAYTRSQGKVYKDGNEDHRVTVEIYFAIPQDNPPLPNQEYKNQIISGARYWNLPTEYIAELEKIEVSP